MGWAILSFGQSFLKGQYGLNRIVFRSKLPIKTTWIKLSCLLIKIFPKDYMSWTILSFHQNFLKRQYGLNRIVFWLTFSSKTILSFGENFLKRQYGMNRIVFWSKLPIKSIWIKLFCVLIKTFQKDYMDYLSIYMGYISFHQNFVKRQYGLNRIVFSSKCS